MPLPEIFVIRHGETEWNRAGRWQGDLDSPLTAKGQKQADDMGLLLEKLNITPDSHTFYSSPIGRARDTATRVLRGQGAPIEDARLREIGVGKWTGVTRDAIRAETGLDEGAHFLDYYAAAPNGERFEQMEMRVKGFLETLTGPSVIITHGITSRFIRTFAMGFELDRILEVPGGQGVIHHVINKQHAELRP